MLLWVFFPNGFLYIAHIKEGPLKVPSDFTLICCQL